MELTNYLRSGKLEQAEREAQRLNIDILGISEARWTSFGEERTPGGGKFLYAGKPDGESHEYGVGFLLSKKVVSSLKDWKPISERIITARFKSKVRYITIVQAYAPTDSADLADKEKFYDELQATMINIKRQDIILVIGDFNAQIGPDNMELEHIMGRHGMGSITENGELFTEFCCENELVIGGSLFPDKDCHKQTWTHHRTRKGYQLDHVCISSKWRGSLLDVRNRRSADIQSDHELVVAEIRLKISRVTQKSQAVLRKYDVHKLKDRKTKQVFSDKLRDLNLSQGIGPNTDINTAWARIRDGFNLTSEKILGKLPPHKEEWITDETWKLIEVRKTLKNSQDEPGINFYRELCRACTTALRRDFRRKVEILSRDAERAAEMRDMKRLYDITRKLANNDFKKQVPVKDKEGKLLTMNEDQLKRWHQHFEETLNFECVTQLAEEEENSREVLSSKINSSPPTIVENRNAIRVMKTGKAAGIDQIAAEMLLVDVNLTADLMFPIFKIVWEQQKLHDDWLQGILVKLPKKGDLSNCSNWRGITLLSIIIINLVFIAIFSETYPLTENAIACAG